MFRVLKACLCVHLIVFVRLFQRSLRLGLAFPQGTSCARHVQFDIDLSERGKRRLRGKQCADRRVKINIGLVRGQGLYPGVC